MSARTAVHDIQVADADGSPLADRSGRDRTGPGGLVGSEEVSAVLHRMRLGWGPSAVRIAGAMAAVTDSGPAVPPPVVDVDVMPGGTSPESCLMELANRLGTPYGYEREHGGALVQQVVAVPGAADEMSSSGSGVELPFHTENSFAATRPDFVVLLCRRRGPTAVPTIVLDANEVMGRLSRSAIETLSMPLFEMRSPSSFGEPPIVTSDASVLELADAGVGLRLDIDDLLTARSREGRAALAEVFEAVDGAGTPVSLEEGEILVIDNRRAAHGRPSFAPAPDGQQRWLQRSLVRIDFWGCRSSMRREGVRVPEQR